MTRASTPSLIVLIALAAFNIFLASRLPESQLMQQPNLRAEEATP